MKGFILGVLLIPGTALLAVFGFKVAEHYRIERLKRRLKTQLHAYVGGGR